ncbi:hypothetical protein HAX54_042808 [Datura stramonium]|uniref:Fatty acyl-CoA reductase n=1 Tax=Datura stramonium TaxID=4076 RepID=A0ABS8SMG6_DATST|nr:hypothetical protein [Datura stramonium]
MEDQFPRQAPFGLFLTENYHNVEEAYLLIRATDSNSAKERFNEVLPNYVKITSKRQSGFSCVLTAGYKNGFVRVLREKLRQPRAERVEDKVFPVPGDIACDSLGISSELKDQMCREIDIIVNSAATTRFDERYDTAISVNVLGAMHVFKFSKQNHRQFIVGYGKGKQSCNGWQRNRFRQMVVDIALCSPSNHLPIQLFIILAPLGRNHPNLGHLMRIGKGLLQEKSMD